jgi:hypothetical protein
MPAITGDETMKTRLSDSELWQILAEAEERKSDSQLALAARINSMQTFSACLREAQKRGYDYSSLRNRARMELLREQH